MITNKAIVQSSLISEMENNLEFKADMLKKIGTNLNKGLMYMYV